MMEISFKWCRFYLCMLFFQLCNGNPINPSDTEAESHAKLLTGVISLLLTVCCLVFLAACLCCQRRKFEQFRNSPVTASSISDLDHGHVNPIANGEFTIFSPISVHYNNNVFHANETKTKPVEDHVPNGYDISRWFSPNEKDYPRTKLKYIKELGTGWFGKVVEGAVQDIDNKGQSWTPVVVRILEATSSQKDKILFLQNASIYRTGDHAHILSLVGKSLETVPFLLLQENCPQGDLKAYLRSHKSSAGQFLLTDFPLIWCHQLTSALKFIHEHNIVHPDLASRNCQLTSNLTLKLGDYGLGPFKYPSDYYRGEPTIPVRWCAPESLIFTQTTIQPKRVTPEGNVWSLAVTMWEICECGEQPYWRLNDDEVISQVLGPPGVRLGIPTHSVLYTDYIFRLMQLCWTSAESRPKVLQIHIMLTDLLQVHKNTSSSDVLDVDEFDRRWESCKPNTIIKTDHISDTLLTLEDGDDTRKSLSLSLTNLHGSLDNLNFSDHETSTNEQSKSNQNFNRDDIFQRTSSGSETEEENWRNKVERGAYTEKVRQKSRSVADLMILTHVDYSESETETPFQSLEYRVNYKNVRLAGCDGFNSLENTSLTYGSEGNLLSVQDTFKEELKKLQEERRDSLPFVPDNVSQNSFRNTDTTNVTPSRLIQELNNPVDIQPVNQVFNIYNVTVDNFSPIHMSNKFSDILDVNCKLKPEWREADKLSKINSQLNQEIKVLEKLNEVQSLNSNLIDSTIPDLIQEVDERIQLSNVDIKYRQELIQVERLNKAGDDVVNDRKEPNKDKSKITAKHTPTPNESTDTLIDVDQSNNSELKEAPTINQDLNKTVEEMKICDIVDIREPKQEDQLKEISIPKVENSVINLGGQEHLSINLNLKAAPIETEEKLDINVKLQDQNQLSDKNNRLTQVTITHNLNEEIDCNLYLEEPREVESNYGLNETQRESEQLNVIKKTQTKTEQLNKTLGINSSFIESEKAFGNIDLQPKVNEKQNEIEKINEVFSNIKLDKSLNEIENFGEVLHVDSELSGVNRGTDCAFEVKDGSDNCDKVETNLSLDILRATDSLIQDACECEAFNFNVQTGPDTDSTVLNLQENKDVEDVFQSDNHAEENLDSPEACNLHSLSKFSDTIRREKSVEETIVTIIDEIIDRSLIEAYDKSINSNIIDNYPNDQNSDNISSEHSDKYPTKADNNRQTDELFQNNDTESKDQIVNFDLSLNQDEIMPNSLTHSSLFTSSTPFSKRSLENKFSSMKFEDNIENYVPDHRDLTYSLETWDNFLGSTLDHQNQHPENMFDSFSSEPRSLLFIQDNINKKCDRDDGDKIHSKVLYSGNDAIPGTSKDSFYDLDDRNYKNDIFNSAFVKEPEMFGHYSQENRSNFSTTTPDDTQRQSDNLFDDVTEPQSLIFIESEGIYKPCDNVSVTETRNKVLHDYDNAKPGTSKDSSYIENNKKSFNTPNSSRGNDVNSSENEGLNSTYTKPDSILNSTYTKESPDVLVHSKDTNEGSFENGGGWFLHPQSTNEPSGEIQVQSSSTDSYIGFGIDDEIMSAIRNELLSKLPHAQGNNSERVKEEDEWDTLERNEVFLRYNVYNTPLSPIPEESMLEDASSSNSPRPERECEEADWSGRTDTDTITNEIESISAHTLESPLRGPLNRQTPSQESCCSNDTLFNLEDLNCGITDLEKDADLSINFKEVESGKKDIEDDDDSQTLKKDDFETENTVAVSERPQEIINSFLSTERNYSSVVPLPSPEENPWKQLPASLLNYNQLTLTNSLSIKDELKTNHDCDNSSELEIYDVENIKTEQDDEESEKINITYTKDHPDVLVLPDLVQSSKEKPEDKIEETTLLVQQDNSDKENIEPLYENSEVQQEVEHSYINANVKAEEPKDETIKIDHLYENTDTKDTDQLYENINTDLDDPFDDYVNVVNMENSRNRLESDVSSDKEHGYIDTYEPIDKDDDDSIYGILTDIRFTGPADSQMMSTSFSENNDEQGWESGSDSRSSSSGEFIWREGEHEESLKALRAAPQDVMESITPMEGIVEDNYEESDISSSFSDDEESPEFVPSAWDKFAMPSKSALRSPEKTLKKREEKKPKGVWFKKQKYHCIYEYPKEPESPVLPSQDVWKQNEFKIFSDNPTSTTNPAEEFFITSSTQPFRAHNLSSQFFPGNSSWTFDNATPDSGVEDITPGSITDSNEFASSSISSVPSLKQLASEMVNGKKSSKISNTDVLGGLRHTRKLLKLDLPPSPNAFSEKIFAIEPTEEPVVREKPAFTTFGKSRFLVQHVDTPSDESIGKNVSFEALPYKPPSPITEVTNKSVNIDDFSYNKSDIVERSLIKNDDDDKCKLKVEIVRGEASLLDSGDEDSGIESTSTLERKLSNPEL